jgi:hypothetical protein
VTRELRVERDTGIVGNFTSSGTSSVGAKEQPLDQALIIFVRNLIPGKVKTRLAAEIGKEDAIHVYQQLLEPSTTVAATTAPTRCLCSTGLSISIFRI